MILNEIKQYLQENSIECSLHEMKGCDSCAVLYKSGPAPKPGPRRSKAVHQLSIYYRHNDFSSALIKANKIFSLLHFPGILKTIDTDKRVIYSSECLSLPSYSGTDDKIRHVFVFDVLIKSINKE